MDINTSSQHQQQPTTESKSQSHCHLHTEQFGSFVQYFTETSASLRPCEICVLRKLKQKMFSFCGCEKGDAECTCSFELILCSVTLPGGTALYR